MKHLSDQEISNYYLGNMSQDEEMNLLIHTAQCSFCAGRLASAFPERELIAPPPELKNQILRTVRKKQFYKSNPKREFYFYSAKVIAGVCMALTLLLSASLTQDSFRQTYTQIKSYTAETLPEKEEAKENAFSKNKISSALRSFSSSVSQSLNKGSNQINEKVFQSDSKNKK